MNLYFIFIYEICAKKRKILSIILIIYLSEKLNLIIFNYYYNYIIIFLNKSINIGDWGLGIGDWGLGVWAHTPKPKPQNPKPHPQKKK